MRAAASLALVAGLAALAFAAAGSAQDAGSNPELIGFKSGDLDLKGFIWKPQGRGPFPAILWNHGSERRPGSVNRVASFFVGRGYVFFVPHRRGQGRSPGPYIKDQLRTAASPLQRSTMLVSLQEQHLGDQLAALAHLKSLSYVDKNRLAAMGFSFGGIQTVLAAELGAGYRVAVSCSAASETWQRSPDLQRRLIAAARHAAIPVFFLQAQNDYDLAPNRALSASVKAAGRRTESKVYPPNGSGPQQGHEFCISGADVWGPDALAFIEASLK